MLCYTTVHCQALEIYNKESLVFSIDALKVIVGLRTPKLKVFIFKFYPNLGSIPDLLRGLLNIVIFVKKVPSEKITYDKMPL